MKSWRMQFACGARGRERSTLSVLLDIPIRPGYRLARVEPLFNRAELLFQLARRPTSVEVLAAGKALC
ncbi:MAG: hypothetical protein HY318_19905 [Armatimonadetes bacterium]|nr:hypothetical protein [Armatimonadota bacterium]